VKIKEWFKVYVSLWALVGLPAFLLSFAWGSPWKPPEGVDVRTSETVIWWLFSLYMISPFVLAPFGVNQRNTD
jgi:hypothetical protein